MNKKYMDDEVNNCIKESEVGGILFLTNNENAMVLYNWLKKKENRVLFFDGEINKEQILNMKVDFIISYNYRYIIKKEVITEFKNKIINLHCSLLPWNRGANPNFWSFIENTPKGVTIHLIDEGLDTGNILIQKELEFVEKNESFYTTYINLHKELVQLFIDNWNQIKSEKIVPYKSPEKGTYHSAREFDDFIKKIPLNWEENISEYKRKILDR